MSFLHGRTGLSSIASAITTNIEKCIWNRVLYYLYNRTHTYEL